MGIDFLDLTFQLEKKHGVYISDAAVKALEQVLEPGPPRIWGSGNDFRVGRFYEVLSNHSVRACPQCHDAPRKKTRWWTFQLTRESERIGGNCPTCSQPLERAKLTGEDFRDSLADVVGKKPAAIHKESWLYRDLGFS